MELSFTVNDSHVSMDTDPLRRLLDVLREDLGLYEVHEGCGEGECGSCGILVNGRIVNACITPVAAVQDCTVQTIEGIRDEALYSRLEDAFAEAGAVQCGYCTAGFVLSAYAFLMDRAATPESSPAVTAAPGATGDPAPAADAAVAAGPASGASSQPPDEEEIRRALAGNLCRCTGYNMIVDAVKRAAGSGES
ncbi:MAG: (2Fe-2S)-binding protein [bacterium]